MTSATTAGATDEDVAYDPAGNFCFAPTPNIITDRGVWYSFVAPAEPVNIIVMGSTLNSEVSVLSGTCDMLDCEATSSPLFTNNSGIFGLQLTEGETYLIYINGVLGDRGAFMVEACTAVVSCDDVTVYLDSTGVDSISVFDLVSATCDVTGVMLSDSVFTCADLAASPITVTVTQGQNSCESAITVLDTIVPVIVCGDITVGLDSTGNVTIENDDAVISIYDNCPDDLSGPFTVGGPSARMFDCTDADSTYQRTVVITDASGNQGSCTYNVTIVDVIVPVIVCEAIEVALDSTGNVTIANDDAVVSIYDNCPDDLSGPFTVGGPTARMFDCLDADSTYQRTVVITDASGNQGSCTYEVTIIDTIVPVIVCEAIEVALDSTGNVTIANDDAVVSIYDNCPDDLSGPFTVGGPTARMFDCLDADSTYQRTVVITDASGNQGSCTYDVTIIDTIAPVIVSCVTDTTIYLDANGFVSIAPGELLVTEDACPPLVLVGDPLVAFDCAAAGEMFVFEEADVDASGNVSETCTITITVLDTVPPVALCQDVTIELDEEGNASIAAGATGTPTAVTQVTGMLDGMDPTFNRPVGGPGACSPSGVGTNVFYETFSFTISAADMYTFAFSGADDLTAALYGGGFDPAAPCANILAYNDDGNGNLDPLIIIQLDLVPGDYTMVITTFGNGATSDYTMDISSANGGQVFAAGGGGG
ncbi:hypothetical protein QWY85_01350, partial [Neolewinella lacunae]